MLQPILFNIYFLLPQKYSIIQSAIQILKKKEKKKESENLSFHPAPTKDEDEAQTG